jgi:Flp pilus assembly protein TadG
MKGHQDMTALTSDQATTVKRNRNPRRLNLEKLCRSCRKSRRGSAVVEFAIVAPVFFAFTLGMVEVGRGVMVQQILTTASREGARQAVLDGATQSAVTTFVTSYLTTATVSAAGTAVTYNPSLPTAAGYSGPVTVTVSVPFNQVSWSPSPIFLKGATLTASTTMQREGIQ